MKNVWIAIGLLGLLVVAFLAGQFFSRGQFLGAGGPPAFRGAGQPGFDQIEFSGESFGGEVTDIDDASFVVQDQDEQFTFQINGETRFISIGTVDGLQVGETVEVIYQADDGDLVALSITSQN